jgi:hypothetical protein
VRITAQLVDAATGAHIWAERYDRELQQISSVQDEVTERLVWALTGRISAAEIGRPKQRRLERVEVQDLVPDSGHAGVFAVRRVRVKR